MPTTYTQVITRAIQNFDDIFDALRSKLVTKSGSTILAAADKTNGTVPADYYAGYIGQLYRVGNVTTSSGTTTISAITPELVDGAIKDYSGVTVTSSNASYGTPDGNNISVSFGIPSAGYYNALSTVTGTLPYNNISLTSANISTYDNTTNYIVRNLEAGTPNNIPMLAVTIPHGSVGVGYGANAQSIQETITASLTIDSAASTVLDASLSGTSADFKVVVKKDANYTATGTITPTVTKAAGFIVDSDVTIATPSFSIDTDMSQGEETIYIPAGGVSNLTLGNSADVNISGSSELGLTTDTPSSGEYYTLTASTADLDVYGEKSHGYITDSVGSTQIGTVTDVTKDYYIKKGVVPDTTIALTPAQLTYTDSSSMVASGTTGHAFTYGVTLGGAVNTTITKGFVNDASYSVNVSGTKTVYIKEAAVSASSTINVDTAHATGDTGILSVGAAGGYTVNIPVSATTSASITANGYLDNSNQITKTGDDVTVTIGVAHGTATITPSLTTALTNVADDNAASAVNETMFYEKVPESGDYYTITSSLSKSVNPGYMQSGDITLVSDVVRYLKKAKFKYVEAMGSSEKSFLEVVSGGYVPSGAIMDIADISGEIDNAAVTVSLTDDGSITTSSPVNGLTYYTITAGKGNVNAGYISSGSGTVEGSVKVLHGSASLATDVTGTTFTPSTGVSALNTTTQKYTLSLVNAVTNTLTFQQGYIKQSDLTLNGTKNVLTKNITDTTTIAVAKGTYAVNTASGNTAFTAGVTVDSNVITADITSANGYEITPTLTGSIIVTTTGAGWIQENNDSKVTHSVADNAGYITHTKKYIKKGTGASAVNWTKGNGTAKINTNFSTTQSGAYTISTSGSMAAELILNEGYYGSAEKTITGGTVSVAGLNSVSVPHGKSEAVLSTTASNLSITSTDTDAASNAAVTILASAPGSGDYVSISATATVHGALTNTEGYIKNIDGDKITHDQNVSLSGFLAGLPFGKGIVATSTDYFTNDVANNTKVYNGITIGSNTGNIDDPSSWGHDSDVETGKRETIILPTKGKYAIYDTKVQLTENAMGTSVVAALTNLYNRLEGKAVS